LEGHQIHSGLTCAHLFLIVSNRTCTKIEIMAQGIGNTLRNAEHTT